MPSSRDRARRAVLLHGLGRSARSMRLLERALHTDGYLVLNRAYRSRAANIATLAAEAFAQISLWEPGATLDFVTHSLGGILLRTAVADGLFPRDRIRRVVMLGPPNGGSELADVLPTVPVIGPIYRRVTGPAGLQLGTRSNGIAARLPAVDFEVGVIAGTRSGNPLFSAILGGSNDGKVRVDRARVSGMADYLEVPYWHPLLIAAPSVIAQVRHFLEHGMFCRIPLVD